jgi:hypothetical protein
VIFVSVNTLLRFSFFLPTCSSAARRSHIMRGFDVLVNTSLLLRTAPVSIHPDIAVRAAHYRGASDSVNTPAHLFLFLLQFVANTAARARIVHGNNPFGKGVRQT